MRRNVIVVKIWVFFTNWAAEHDWLRFVLRITNVCVPILSDVLYAWRRTCFFHLSNLDWNHVHQFIFREKYLVTCFFHLFIKRILFPWINTITGFCIRIMKICNHRDRLRWRSGYVVSHLHQKVEFNGNSWADLKMERFQIWVVERSKFCAESVSGTPSYPFRPFCSPIGL